MSNNTYLSIVATSRNDGHGGNILKRTQLFINGLISQSNRHKFPLELIIVEWNPPKNKPRLREVLPMPSYKDNLVLRYIEVPADLHNQYKRAKEIPLFQMIAKNVGIRRANGTFVLCTNVDLLFSDQLFQRFSNKDFRNDTYYRATRCDVPDGIDPIWTFERQLAWCEKNIMRRLGKDPKYEHTSLNPFIAKENPRWKKWIYENFIFKLQSKSNLGKKAYARLDSYACGDFTLMAKECWLKIGGYPELDLYSIHVDTLGLIAAGSHGMRQHVFPRSACTYHIDHPLGWETMTPLEKLKFLEERPGVDYGTLYEIGISNIWEKTALQINPSNWGFADLSFEEYICKKGYSTV